MLRPPLRLVSQNLPVWGPHSVFNKPSNGFPCSPKVDNQGFGRLRLISVNTKDTRGSFFLKAEVLGIKYKECLKR